MAYINPLGALLKLVRVPPLNKIFETAAVPVRKKQKKTKKKNNKKKHQTNKPILQKKICEKNITKCSSFQYKKLTTSSPRGFRFAVKF